MWTGPAVKSRRIFLRHIAFMAENASGCAGEFLIIHNRSLLDLCREWESVT